MLDSYLIRLSFCKNSEQVKALVAQAYYFLNAAEYQILIDTAIAKLDSILENLAI